MALVEGKGRGRELCGAGISILDEGDRGGADPPEGDEPREVGGDYPFGKRLGQRVWPGMRARVSKCVSRGLLACYCFMF